MSGTVQQTWRTMSMRMFMRVAASIDKILGSKGVLGRALNKGLIFLNPRRPLSDKLLIH